MDNFIYKKMEFPLGPFIAGVLRLNWKEFVISATLMTSWKSCADGTIAYVVTNGIEHVLSILNSFHGNISFTYEQEIN